jgi:hypothetical protein
LNHKNKFLRHEKTDILYLKNLNKQNFAEKNVRTSSFVGIPFGLPLFCGLFAPDGAGKTVYG